MRIAILTKETFSTYLYNLVAGLHSMGFDDVGIIRVSKSLKKETEITFAKFKFSTLNVFLRKTIDLLIAYSRYIRIRVRHNVEQYRFKSFDNNDLVMFLNQKKFDVVIAYNTGLLNEKILSIPKFGVICAHPALLPFGRGFSGHLQSVLANVPMGVTVFKINNGIDTGDIYLQQELDISRCKSVHDLKREFSKKELELTFKVIKGISQNRLFPKKQEQRYKYWKLSVEEIKKANQKLNEIFSRNKRKS